jgi:hypothetical protein
MLQRLVVAAFALLTARQAFALDTTSVLPAGINSPAVRYGVVSGIDQKFTSHGTVMSLTDWNAKEFNAQELRATSSEAKQLISILDQLGHNQLGEALNLGVLRIDTHPDIKYWAPIYARGITNDLTLAFAVPIFNYHNDIKLTESQSNVTAIHNQVGYANADLNNAFSQLDQGIVSQLKKTLSQKGYRPLQTRDETIVGDMQFVGVYNFLNKKTISGASRTTFNAPTGPKDDPDDLTDLTMFGETSIEEMVIGNYNVSRSLQLAAKASYKMTLPDDADMRVPSDESDGLPDASRREVVSRNLGDSMSIGTSFFYEFFMGFKAGLGAEREVKGADRYSGSRGWRYDLLSKNTDSEANRIRAGVEYSSTQAYLKGKALLPFIAGYAYTDTVAGRNTERRMVHEFSLTMFF